MRRKAYSLRKLVQIFSIFSAPIAKPALLASLWVMHDVSQGNTFNGALYSWVVIGKLKMEVGFLIDQLTAMMMVVVTFVSLMVHVYTIGYMEEDDGYQRFFAYISLFTFSMLMLVMSNNLLQLLDRRAHV